MITKVCGPDLCSNSYRCVLARVFSKLMHARVVGVSGVCSQEGLAGRDECLGVCLGEGASESGNSKRKAKMHRTS